MSQTKLMVALRDSDHVDDLVKLACQLTRAMEAELTAIHWSKWARACLSISKRRCSISLGK